MGRFMTKIWKLKCYHYLQFDSAHPRNPYQFLTDKQHHIWGIPPPPIATYSELNFNSGTQRDHLCFSILSLSLAWCNWHARNGKTHQHPANNQSGHMALPGPCSVGDGCLISPINTSVTWSAALHSLPLKYSLHFSSASALVFEMDFRHFLDTEHDFSFC